MNLPTRAQHKLTLDDIDTGVSLVREKVSPDERDIIERVDADHQAALLRNKLAESQIKNIKADRKMRKQYAGRILRYLELYSGGVALIIIIDGFHVFGFNLDQHVTITLVGSTAIAAIGLVGFIARGLFGGPPR